MASCTQLHLQAFYNIRIELSSTSQLAQFMCQLFNCLEYLRFQPGDIVGFVGGGESTSFANWR